jgi:hypothetical protein
MASPSGRAFRYIFYRRIRFQSHDAEKGMVFFFMACGVLLPPVPIHFSLSGEGIIAYGSNGIFLFNQ